VSETASLASLFFSSLLGATLLPGGSEAVLFAVLKAYPESLWLALLLASVGNTLGGMITFGMGWMLPQFGRGGAEHSGAGGTAPGSLTGNESVPDEASRARTQQLKHVEKVRKYGAASLLLAWLPLVGDALCLAAGWLRLNPLAALAFMAAGKFARYALVACTI
jgi:membrane protein YqaA with SNARE-associated domain